MENIKPIAILMATYNGEAFLSEQIDSILAQTSHDWHLYIHDDGSMDATTTIISQYTGQYPDLITALDYPSQGGACKNFLSMLDRIEAPYYMFCDQDDVWLPEKVKMQYQDMLETERNAPGRPVIVNTDLCVVDSHLQVISPSFWQYERIDPDWLHHYENHAAVHSVTGCTMLFNQQAKSVVKHPYDQAEMHDVWIGLSVAAHDGVLTYIHQAPILYRQHASNTLGAQDAATQTWKYKLRNVGKLLHINRIHYLQMNAVSQISLLNYIKEKVRYKKYILSKSRHYIF